MGSRVFNMEMQHYSIVSEDGIEIDAHVCHPKKGRIAQHATSGLAVVLSHPHSKFGGSSRNMQGIARILADDYGIASVAFDWRGVGNSGGQSSWFGSDGEIADYLAVCEWAVENLPAPRGCILVGSSGGAPIAGRAAAESSSGIVGYVGIGYTFGVLTSLLWGHHYEPLLTWSNPKLFIMGESDEHTSVSQLESRAEGAEGICEVSIVE